MKLELTILTPERRISLPNLRQVVFPSPQGEAGVLAGHAALISLVATGIVRAFSIEADADEPPRSFVVEAGSLRAVDDDLVLLTPQVFCEDELDVTSAEADLDQANAELAILDPFLDEIAYHDWLKTVALCQAVLELDHELSHRRTNLTRNS